jgi:GNAT superfamily N-acetyltransferase
MLRTLRPRPDGAYATKVEFGSPDQWRVDARGRSGHPCAPVTLDVHRRACVDALLARDSARARRAIDAALEAGVPIPDVYLDVFRPAPAEIGQQHVPPVLGPGDEPERRRAGRRRGRVRPARARGDPARLRPSASLGDVRIRQGGAADAGIVLALFDEAVEWLVARGQTGQWGSEPFSSQEKHVAVAAEWAAGGGLRVAEDEDGEAVGAIVLGARPAWVSPAPAAELYVQALVTSRRHAGQDIGGELIRRAVAETRAAGRPLLRVDCWRDAPGLVAWYERQGFRPSGTFEVNGWRGQVLSMEI